jgi:hypothetical protein
VNVLAIGDVHFRDTDWVTTPRLNKTLDDLARMTGRGTLDAVVQVGDQTSYATTAEFDAYLTWRNAIRALHPGIPVQEVPGNHDLCGGNPSGTPDVVTTAQWAQIMGRADGAKDMVVDIGTDVRLLLLAPTADSTGTLSTGVGFTAKTRTYLDSADIAWCDVRLGETDRQCVIFFHAPLFQTHGPLDGSAFSSYDPAGRWVAHAGEDTIEAMIARHDNIVAWVSGHSHSVVDEVDIVKQMTHGTTVFAAINAASPSSANPDRGRQNNMIATCLLSIYPDRIEVRYRDNGAGQWLDPIHTVPL